MVSLISKKITIYECNNIIKFLENIYHKYNNYLIIMDKINYSLFKNLINIKKYNIINEDKYLKNNYNYYNYFFINLENFKNIINFDKIINSSINILTNNYDLLYFNNKIKIKFDKKNVINYSFNEYDYTNNLKYQDNINFENYDLIISKYSLNLNKYKKKAFLLNNNKIFMYIKKQINSLFFCNLDIKEINFILNNIIPQNLNNNLYFSNIK